MKARHSELGRIVREELACAPRPSCSTSACPRCNWTRPSAASASSPTDRSTCAWIPASTARRPTSNHWDERDLADLFYYEGGETCLRAAARAIVESRRRAPFLRTGALADCIARAFGGQSGKIHPATLVFQALRRAVNQEGEELAAALSTAERELADGGRLLVITFHSGEDSVVKRHLAALARAGRFELLTKKPIEADPAERRANPRSRSAKLRAAVRTRGGDHGEAPIEVPLAREGRP